ncbi:MAG: hypothetical protein MUF62_07645 [Chitinophagaceae bacterium]|nr:hypothetical protein [Chitinophagaceae bacterium]
MRSLELEDQSWFPPLLRFYQMEYLSWLAARFGLYAPLTNAMQYLLQCHPSEQWTDCCSGAAGPVASLIEEGIEPRGLILADQYPQLPSELLLVPFDLVHYRLPADSIPGEGLVTMFNAFHHFAADVQQQWLQQAAAQQRPLLVAEITRPTLLSWLAVTLAGTLGVLLFTPFIQPFSFKRLLFTYLLPINIISITWDGWMSVFGATSRSRMQQLATQLHSAHYKAYYFEAGPWWRRLAVLAGEPITPSGVSSFTSHLNNHA